MLKLFFKVFNNILNNKQRFETKYVIILNFFYILIEMISISAVVPVIIIYLEGNLDQINIPFISFIFSKIDNYFIAENLYNFSIILLFIFLFKLFFSIYINYINIKLNHYLTADISTELYKKNLNLNWSELLNKNSSDWINNTSLTVDAFIKNFFIGIILIIRAMTMTIVLIIFLGLLHTQMTIYTLLFFSILIVSYYLVLAKPVKILGERRIKYNEEYLRFIAETAKVIREIKIYNLENFFNNNFKKIKYNFERMKLIKNMINFLPRGILEFVVLICIFLFLFSTSIYADNLARTATLMSLFAMISIKIIPQLIFIYKSANSLKFSQYAAISIYEILSQKNNENISQNNKEIKFDKEIVINNLNFKYENSTKSTFENVNMKINKNEIVGIIGSSGSGKTTFSNIIMGLLKPNYGSVTVDELDIAQNLKNWQEKISFVPQEISLFDNTIKNNILFSNNFYDDNNKLLNNVINDSQINELIKNLPEGINTQVGENGARISIGERQRIGIARALYKRPKLIIFDESTSALDEKNEIKFIETIKNLNQNCTLIIISHKKYPLSICDSIYELKDKSILKIK